MSYSGIQFKLQEEWWMVWELGGLRTHDKITFDWDEGNNILSEFILRFKILRVQEIRFPLKFKIVSGFTWEEINTWE